MVANIAQQVLNENRWTITQITIVNLEYLIDNAADYINLMSGTSIANIAASALTATENELIVVKTLAALMVRAYLDRGPNVAVSSVSISSVLADPQYDLFTKIVENGIARLKLVPTATTGIAFSVGTDDGDLV